MEPCEIVIFAHQNQLNISIFKWFRISSLQAVEIQAVSQTHLQGKIYIP